MPARHRSHRFVAPTRQIRQVPDHRIEPDVEPLVGVVLPARQRNRYAPVDVTRHRPRSKVVKQVEREAQHIGTPVGAGLKPRTECIGQRRQVEEEVFGLDEPRCLTVDPRVRVDELVGVELVAAVVALVATGAVVTANRAGALDVAVGQGAAGRRRYRATRRAFDQVAIAVQRREHLLDHRIVVPRRGPGEEVIAQAELLEVFSDHPVVPVGEILRGDAFMIGLHEDRRAVLVGTAHHEDVITGEPVIAREDIRGDTEASDVTNVSGTVRVRPCDRGQDVPGHASRLFVERNLIYPPPRHAKLGRDLGYRIAAG